MHTKDKISREYMGRPEVLADLFNFYYKNTKFKIEPSRLRVWDTRQGGIHVKREEGKAEGRVERRNSILLEHVYLLIQKAHMSMEEAMDFLETSEENRQSLRIKLTQRDERLGDVSV